jgi:hypothetical protein
VQGRGRGQPNWWHPRICVACLLHDANSRVMHEWGAPCPRVPCSGCLQLGHHLKDCEEAHAALAVYHAHPDRSVTHPAPTSHAIFPRYCPAVGTTSVCNTLSLGAEVPVVCIPVATIVVPVATLVGQEPQAPPPGELHMYRVVARGIPTPHLSQLPTVQALPQQLTTLLSACSELGASELGQAAGGTQGSTENRHPAEQILGQEGAGGVMHWESPLCVTPCPWEQKCR